MNYERYNEKSASSIDRLAWLLCQIIDDDAPLQWTRYRGSAACLLSTTNNLRGIIEQYTQEEN